MSISTFSPQAILPYLVAATAIGGGMAVAVIEATPAAIIAGSILVVFGVLFIACIALHKNSIYNVPGAYTSSLIKFTTLWIAGFFYGSKEVDPLKKWEDELKKGAI